MNRLAVSDEYTRREEMATFRVMTRIRKTDISLQLNSISHILRARRVEGQRQREYEDTDEVFRTFALLNVPLIHEIRCLFVTCGFELTRTYSSRKALAVVKLITSKKILEFVRVKIFQLRINPSNANKKIVIIISNMKS